jgi:hypothetical protein
MVGCKTPLWRLRRTENAGRIAGRARFGASRIQLIQEFRKASQNAVSRPLTGLVVGRAASYAYAGPKPLLRFAHTAKRIGRHKRVSGE